MAPWPFQAQRLGVKTTTTPANCQEEGHCHDDKADEIFDIACGAGVVDTAEDADTARALFRRRMRGASSKRLATSLQTWKRWARWADDKPAVDLHEPGANHLGKFLLETVAGGPTAAAQVWSHLEWWRAKVGIDLPTQALQLARCRNLVTGSDPPSRFPYGCG